MLTRTPRSVVLFFAICGCHSETILQTLAPITVAPRNVLLTEGMVLQMEALVSPDVAAPVTPISWSSSASGVASVDANGFVNAVAAGTATIIARVDTLADSTVVTVRAPTGASIVSGRNFVCGITPALGAMCFGDNKFNQTGTGSKSLSLSDPTPVLGGLTWRSLAGSANHVCGIDTQGDIYCWGLGAVGQLGTGAESDLDRPITRVVGGKKFVEVSANGSTWVGLRGDGLTDPQETCGLTREGEAFCWGLEEELNTSGTFRTSAPTAAAPGIRFATLSVGYGYVCGISIDRTTYCWGNNEFGQLGRARASFDRGPKPVEGGLRFNEISAGGIHTCGVVSDGTAYCWGANGGLQLGFTSTEQCEYQGAVVPCQSHPVAVPGYRFTSVAAGKWPSTNGALFGSHTCGITVDQIGVCWGWNGNAQVLGFAEFNVTNFAHPPTLPALPNIKLRAISAGSDHNCGVITNSQGVCWGFGLRFTIFIIPGGVVFK